MKIGSQAYQHNPDDYYLHWTNLPPSYPLLTQFFYQEMVIHHYTQDFKCKSHHYFQKGGHWAFTLPKLQDLLLILQILYV